MFFRNLLLIAALSFTTTAYAAFTVCTLETQPCDRAGGHFFCTTMGWTGPNSPRFCSAEDVSSGPGRSKPNPKPVPFASCYDTRGRVSILYFHPSEVGNLGTARLYVDGKSGELNCGVSNSPGSEFLVACSGNLYSEPDTQIRLRISFPTTGPEKIGVLEVSPSAEPSPINEMIPVHCD